MQEVSLFIPCIVDQWLPHIGISTAALLQKAGCSPFFRMEQTCCGQFLYNAGQPERARKLARRFIEIFEQDEVIVSPSASCVHMVRKNYPLLFEGMPEWRRRAESLAGRVFELCEFMVDRMEVTDLGARFAGKAAFHESCSHLYGLGISGQPRLLLEAVEGLELAAMEGADICCGFGGKFSVSYPDISSAMVSDKADNFVASRADVLVLCEPGCLLNIGGYVSRHYPEKQVVHMASFLADHL